MTTPTTDPELRTSGPMMKWLWIEYLSRHKGWLAVAVVLMVAEGLTFGSLSLMMQPMFDRVFCRWRNGQYLDGWSDYPVNLSCACGDGLGAAGHHEICVRTKWRKYAIGSDGSSDRP